MATTKKFFIKRVHLGRVDYKRYKCIEGWCRDKSMCWQFSKQGALRIVEVEKRAIHPSQKNDYEFSIEEADI